MMQIQYVSKYIALSEEGLVPRLACPVDQGSLFVNQDLSDSIFLYCLECKYKKYLGLEFYSQLKKLVDTNNVEKE
jgi:hypothetical protein